MLMRATAASASSKITFSVSRTLIPRREQTLEDVREDTRPVPVANDEQVAGRRPRRQIDDVRNPPGLAERPDDADGLGGDRLLSLFRGRPDVVRAVDARQIQERQVEFAGPGRRLAGENVQTDADPAFADGVGDSVVVEDLGSRRIDEDRSRPQPSDDVGVDEAASRVGKGEVDAQDVRLGRDLAGRRRDRDATAPSGRVEAVAVEHADVSQRPAAEPSNRRDQITRSSPNAWARRATSWAIVPEPEESERRAPSGPSPLRTPSCPSGRHGARRRCRGSADRAR